MKRLAIALIEQALADAVNGDLRSRETARAFLFSNSPEAVETRQHWLREAGLPLDAFDRLAGLSQSELKKRFRLMGSVSR